MCAVAFMQEKRIHLYDSNHGRDRRHYLDRILEYLKEEHWVKKGKELPNLQEWKDNLNVDHIKTPKQGNGACLLLLSCIACIFLVFGALLTCCSLSLTAFSSAAFPGSDCGVFTCMITDFISVGYPLSFDEDLTFNQERITKCRVRELIASAIMTGEATFI